MKTLLLIATLFVLTGCESMDFTTVSVGTTYSTYRPHAHHISYTLGYYTSSHYNGYRVYGPRGHRYYYAPRGYRHHRHYSTPPVIVRNYYVQPRHRHHDNRRHDNRRDRRHDNRNDRRHDRRRHDRRDDRRDHRRDHRREDERRHRR